MVTDMSVGHVNVSEVEFYFFTERKKQHFAEVQTKLPNCLI